MRPAHLGMNVRILEGVVGSTERRASRDMRLMEITSDGSGWFGDLPVTVTPRPCRLKGLGYLVRRVHFLIAGWFTSFDAGWVRFRLSDISGKLCRQC